MLRHAPSDDGARRWQFRLRTLLLLCAVAALALTLLKLGGGGMLLTALLLGVSIGGGVSILGSNKAAAAWLAILYTSLAAALASAILGVLMTGFDVEDALPQGFKEREILRLASCGALLGAVAGAVARRHASRSNRSTDPNLN